MQRYDDWPSRLSSYLESRRHTQFAYGSHDCCLFVADAIEAMTGVDVAAHFRDQYHSRFGALRRLRERSVRPTVDVIAGQVFGAYGLPEIQAAYAQRGDVLALSLDREGVVLGLVALDGMPIIAAEQGWGVAGRSYALRGWHV